MKNMNSKITKKKQDQTSHCKVFDILAKLIEDNEKFTDQDFKPELSSICKDPANENYEKFKELEWKRPDEVLDSNQEIKVFNNIDVNDIK